MTTPQFSQQSRRLFIFSCLLLTVGFTCLAIDPEANGFGILTRWIAPPLLIVGFFLPISAITGKGNSLFSFLSFHQVKTNSAKHGFALVAFLSSFIIYIFTLEPTASLWDCSEFIACAYKLQVPHTPGTPLSLLMGRLFSMLSFGNVHQVAWCINMMSAFFSALAVSLVYYIAYSFAERIQPLQQKNTAVLIAASLCSSLCLAFSDTFWFSAVEAETYGIACFFMLLLFQIMLLGKDLPQPEKSRCLILIAYLSGLSYCIHPMCLLVIPVLPFLWRSNSAVRVKQVFIFMLAGLVIVFLINRLIAVGVFELAFVFDRFFVNQLHFPFYTGALILIVLFVFCFYLLLRKIPQYGGYTWAVIFLLLGFLPYLVLFIRSNHNPPIDETNPENLASIKAYMNRESYPSSPILYGPYYDATITDVEIKNEVYFKGDDIYKVAGTLPKYIYDHSRETLLPRMYSRDESHIEAYRKWAGLKPTEKPYFYDNLKFMIRYQLGHMYLRYFLWNFAGRESDVQHSQWLSPWEGLNTEDILNKAHNQYWMIPFLAGLLGMFYQYKKDKKNFYANTILFLATGIVLVLYLNSTPNEPRERDYIYVGSYIAFSIWIGLGALALRSTRINAMIQKIMFITICLSIPAWMLYQNYDDHDRSGRTFQIDHARSTLNSCAPNAILFTGGDNDTFPLWYLQEVEEYRTDVRVVVLSYFNTDWYINQLRKKYYTSEPFNFSLNKSDYLQYGPNDVLYIDERIKEGIDVEEFLNLLKEEHPALTSYARSGELFHILPSRTLKLKVDKESEIALSSASDTAETKNELIISVEQDYIEKSVLALLDLIVSNHWKRPIYLNYTSMNTIGIDLKPYLIQEGLVFRLSSTENEGRNTAIDTERTFKNLVIQADYTNLSDKNVYFNYEDYVARIIIPLQESFNTLAEAYLKEGDKKMATNVMEQAVKKLYPHHLAPSFPNLHAAVLLLAVDRKDLANDLSARVFEYSYDRIIKSKSEIAGANEYLLRQSAVILNELGKKEYLIRADSLEDAFKNETSAKF